MQIPILPQATCNLYTNVKKTKFLSLGEGGIIDTDTLKYLNETRCLRTGAQMVTDSKIPEGSFFANSVIFKMLENMSAYQLEMNALVRLNTFIF